MSVVHDTPLTVAEILGNHLSCTTPVLRCSFSRPNKLIPNKAMGFGFRPCMALACLHQQF